MSRYYRPSNPLLEQNVFPANPFSSYQLVTNIPYARNSNKTVQQPEITVISPPLPGLVLTLAISSPHPTPPPLHTLGGFSWTVSHKSK